MRMTRRILLLAFVMLATSMSVGKVQATDVYRIDPVAAKYTVIVDSPLSPAGGSVDLRVSDGISGKLTYPANDACAGAGIHIAALGPAGVTRSDLDTVFVRGWKPFYVLTLTLEGGKCNAERITFKGFPQLSVRDAKAVKSTVYYMDLVVESGNATHIPIGPPDERDARNVVFSFSSLPVWAHSGAGNVSVPTFPTYRMIIGRQ